MIRSAAMFLWVCGFIQVACSQEKSSDSPLPTDYGQPAGLPRPSDMSVRDFEAKLFQFLNERKYVQLGWLADKQVRDTGPFINGNYYGTHPAVRIYYSPEIIEWLAGGRQSVIPDGAVIVKEQYEPPAARHENLDDDALWQLLQSWTVMVKDSRGSHDGWFWSNPAKGQQLVDYFAYPFEEPYSGFGLYCLRCHGATKSPGISNEYTFASLRNIAGFPGEPLLFRVDDSWRESPNAEPLTQEPLLVEITAASSAETPGSTKAATSNLPSAAHPRCAESDQPTRCLPELNQDFLECYKSIATCERTNVLHLPPVTLDSVPRSSSSGNEQAFVTSNQCMSCHAGITEPFGPTMFIPTGAEKHYGASGINVSPYGEWRWTPMGLAGRDPVFYAQLESELALLDRKYDPQKSADVSRNLQKTCLGCHGAMGRRQHDIDFVQDTVAAEDPSPSFTPDYIYQQEVDPKHADFEGSKYGALARDGVSCAVCHRMQPRPQPEGDQSNYLEHFLRTSITGNFYLGKPNEIYGPFKDDVLAPYIMEHSIGIRPKYSTYLQSSQLCGTCHTVNLPVVNWEKENGETHNDLMLAEPNPELRDFHHHVEQATYLEWLNSEYENEFDAGNPKAKTCQQCHMSRGIRDVAAGIDIPQIRTAIATVQDTSYPDAENLAEHKELNVRRRDEGYARHNFRGLNAFMVEMFNQFDDILGVRKHDYMTGSKTDLSHSMDDFVRQAREETATIGVKADWNADLLEATVEVCNLAGHRFPSGVGFRRAFVELLVIDESQLPEEQIVWSSGRTNSLGVIVDQAGQPLPTEFFDDSNATGVYQPHHETITASNQVQIYETLLQTIEGEFTTSFVHGCTTIKDNRLLPRGWSRKGPGAALNGHFLSATYPGPAASQDGRYQDGSGSDVTTYKIALPVGTQRDKLRVTATLYYQALPPYFLKNLFETAPDGPATRRLHYICSNMKLAGTPIEKWKLQVVSAETSVKNRNSSTTSAAAR
ncbi:MAG: cytochrome P460 family protein [Planctomycetales bacterium]|nr:cytochrome P460 family protein [Planctomycetales bacterium]